MCSSRAHGEALRAVPFCWSFRPMSGLSGQTNPMIRLSSKLQSPGVTPQFLGDQATLTCTCRLSGLEQVSWTRRPRQSPSPRASQLCKWCTKTADFNRVGLKGTGESGIHPMGNFCPSGQTSFISHQRRSNKRATLSRGHIQAHARGKSLRRKLGEPLTMSHSPRRHRWCLRRRSHYPKTCPPAPPRLLLQPCPRPPPRQLLRQQQQPRRPPEAASRAG